MIAYGVYLPIYFIARKALFYVMQPYHSQFYPLYVHIHM